MADQCGRWGRFCARPHDSLTHKMREDQLPMPKLFYPSPHR